ncbi:hypothetical protein U1Q18_041672, partial [Sarracenia purpurea var. burkii]
MNKYQAKRAFRTPAMDKKTNQSGDKIRASPNRFLPLFPGTNDYEEVFPPVSRSPKSQKDPHPPDHLFMDVAEVKDSLLSLIRDFPLDHRSRRTVFAEVKCLDEEVNLAKVISASRMSLETRINELKGLSSTTLMKGFNLSCDEDEASVVEDRYTDVIVENGKMRYVTRDLDEKGVLAPLDRRPEAEEKKSKGSAASSQRQASKLDSEPVGLDEGEEAVKEEEGADPHSEKKGAFEFRKEVVPVNEVKSSEIEKIEVEIAVAEESNE